MQSYHITALEGSGSLLQRMTDLLIHRAHIRYAIWVMVGQYDKHPQLGRPLPGLAKPVIRYKPAKALSGLEQEPVPINGAITDRNQQPYVDRQGFYLGWHLIAIRTDRSGRKVRNYGGQFPVPMTRPAAQIGRQAIDDHILKGLDDGPERANAQAAFAELWNTINATYHQYKQLGHRMRVWYNSDEMLYQKALQSATTLARDAVQAVKPVNEQ